MTITNKTYLVTGASGFLGNKLVDRLLWKGANVVAMARNEGQLIKLHQDFPEIKILSGDVSDKVSVHQALRGVDGVFHLAAFKHVGLAEEQVRECIKSNTIGSLNILEESLNHELDFVIGVSTDKAAQVSGVYGASKLLMERLFKQFESNNSRCKYRIVRYGNVLYSTGSVLCKWKKIIEEGGELLVTDKNATRFYWTIDQALDLINDCLENAVDSTPYCPAMKSMKLIDLLNAMIDKYSTDPTMITVREIGLGKGENLHEKILDEGPFSNETERFSKEEIQKLI